RGGATASQGPNLKPLRYCGSCIISPSHGFRDTHRRHQILLQRRHYGIGADLHFWVARMIITACKSQACDGNESGEMRQLRRSSNLGCARHILCSSTRRFAKALSTQAVATNMRMT